MKTRYKVLGLLSLVSAITYLDRICLSVAGPAMQSALGLRPDQWGWVVGSFVLTYALFAMPAASLGHRRSHQLSDAHRHLTAVWHG
jgi:ACS family glucarate transporter-like MFS transporter